MTTVFRTLGQVTSRLLSQAPILPQRPVPATLQTVARNNLLNVCQPLNLLKRLSSNYDPYPNFETPSPYKMPAKYRHGYKYKYLTEGPLPRPKGHYEDEPLPLEPKPTHKRDQWSRQKALFGQNDYIDILGDGTIHPAELMDGPKWLQGFKGNEFQRLLRQMEFNGRRLREEEPTKYHSMCKRIWFLYKKLNRRRHARFWGSRNRAAKSRIDRRPFDFGER